MVNISNKQLTRAIEKAETMDLKNKELACDKIFVEQPNLLASVLVMQQMGSSLEEIDVLLNILIVFHLALLESGQKIAKVSEQDQDHQLRLFENTVKFSEGMDSNLIDSSINQYIKSQKHPLLLSFVAGVMKDAGFYEKQNESSKYLIMAGINLANCVAHAIKLA
jgi:hypothetical protein